MPTFTVQSASKKKDVDGRHGPMQVIALTLQNGDGAVNCEWFTKASTPLPSPGQTLEGELSDGQYGKNFKKAQQPRSNGSGGYARSPEERVRIERQHSQEMAVRLLAAFEPRLDGRTAKTYLSLVKELTDWFVADLGNAASTSAPSSPARTSDAPAPAGSGGTPAGAQGFASEKQQTFFERLLTEAGASPETLEAIVLYAKSLPKQNISRIIDALRENPREVGGQLAADANEWAAKQPSDIPRDDRDLPRLDPHAVVGDPEGIPF